MHGEIDCGMALGDGVLITEPEYRWETSGGTVNEGPVALQRDGQTYLIFSASSWSRAATAG